MLSPTQKKFNFSKRLGDEGSWNEHKIHQTTSLSLPGPQVYHKVFIEMLSITLRLPVA